MGSNLSSGGLFSNSAMPEEDCSCLVQLGKHAAINLSEREVLESDDDGSFKERWTISYNVHGSQINLLQLIKKVGKDGNVNELELGINEFYYGQKINFLIPIKTLDRDFLFGKVTFKYLNCRGLLLKSSTSYHPWGGTTFTHVFMYGNGNTRGLLVAEAKKTSENGMCYAFNVAHYYANSSGNIFSKTDIGLSVVAGIRASRCNLDITVEGPLSHPASALFYMFDHVYRSVVWKPTACPHCAMNVRKQRGKMFMVSDSEDSDSVPPRPGSQQNARNLVNRGGAYHGNGNGNFFEGHNTIFL